MAWAQAEPSSTLFNHQRSALRVEQLDVAEVRMTRLDRILQHVL
jgi:hypothetical protein